MALKLSTTTPFGFDAVDAYHRVGAVQVVNKTQLFFNVQSFKDVETARPFNEQQYSCDYEIAGNNPIAQAYEHLKTLPEFSDAVDC